MIKYAAANNNGIYLNFLRRIEHELPNITLVNAQNYKPWVCC